MSIEEKEVQTSRRYRQQQREPGSWCLTMRLPRAKSFPWINHSAHLGTDVSPTSLMPPAKLK
ncbi:hypothetical protein ACSS6W_005704 [Trichoderma asperelloides]|nr:hypothetical protein LI328DRAFT_124289 [Trichoderma asperelloides]